ncbi:MAG: hypothetical protein RIR20_199, partial [Pseudomonadota bacterium]
NLFCIFLHLFLAIFQALKTRKSYPQKLWIKLWIAVT